MVSKMDSPAHMKNGANLTHTGIRTCRRPKGRPLSLLLVVAMAVSGTLTKAQTVTWTLQDVTFANGMTASGTIDVNTATALVTSWDVTFGGALTGYSTTSFGTSSPDGDNLAELGTYETTPVQDTLVIEAGTEPALSGHGLEITMELMANNLFPAGSPSTIPLLVTTPSLQESYIDEYNYITGGSASQGNLVTGSIIETVPEPGSLGLVAFGALAICIFRSLRGRNKIQNQRAGISNFIR